MRKIFIGEREITIRPLTKKEIKLLKPLGYSYLGCQPLMTDLEGVIDTALDIAIDPESIEYLDGQAMKDTRTVWRELLKETYGDKDEEKNSQSTGDGTTTASASNIAEPA